MIPAHSSSVNGAVLKIRKIVPRLDFSSRAISARPFPAAYSSMTRMCRGEIRPRFAFRLFRRSAFATGGMIDLITLNATSHIFRQPATNHLERRIPQFHPIPTLRILHATFSEVDYNTGFEAVEELRKLVPLGVSMSQFGPALDSACSMRTFAPSRRQTGR